MKKECRLPYDKGRGLNLEQQYDEVLRLRDLVLLAEASKLALGQAFYIRRPNALSGARGLKASRNAVPAGMGCSVSELRRFLSIDANGTRRPIGKTQ